MAGAPLAVLYDAECGVCRVSVALLLRTDPGGRLRPVPIQGAEGQRLLADVPPERRLASAHVVDADGQVTSGGDGAAVIAATVPALRVFAPALHAAGPLVRGGYDLVAAHRSRLGPLASHEVRRRADLVLARRGA
jgi:predicted DCC family thiol-disulfide oxidoreductase YuxK